VEDQGLALFEKLGITVTGAHAEKARSQGAVAN